VVLAALTLEDLLLVVSHQMLLKGLGGGEVLEGTGLDGTAEEALCVLEPDVLQEGEEAVEHLGAAVTRLQTNLVLPC